jgi:hypothetical protein
MKPLIVHKTGFHDLKELHEVLNIHFTLEGQPYKVEGHFKSGEYNDLRHAISDLIDNFAEIVAPVVKWKMEQLQK